jgi:hypothetical protein
MIYPMFAVMLSLTTLMAPSMGSSFVPKLSASVRLQPDRVLISTLRGGSNSDTVRGPDSDSKPPLSNPVASPPIPEPPPALPLPVETMETGNFVSPPIPVVVEEALQCKGSLGPNACPPGLFRRKFPDFPWHLIPNWLTYFRCLAIPLFVGVFYLLDNNIAASSLFAVASATDFIDGYLARKWDIASAFGAFLDPVVRTNCRFCAVILFHACHTLSR